MRKQSAPEPMALGGRTRICKSVLAYNTVDLAGHSVWALTNTEALFAGRPVVASEQVYQAIAMSFPAGPRIPPEQAAQYRDVLSAQTAILTHVHLKAPGADADYWPIAADMVGAFLETNDGVAIIGEGAGQVRLLLVAPDEPALAALASLAMTGSLPDETRYLFFTGKGGVGKTSLSCSTAIALADRGKRVLLVSTDPASNLDDVLGLALGPEPQAIPGVPGLMAANLDPEAAAAAYREKVIGPYRGLLPEAAVASMEEQLSGACTVEIAAFDEFARLLGRPEATQSFDHVIFDTAPTGHTLRLLSLPSAWEGFIETNTTGTSCLGPLAGLQEQRGLYQASVHALADGGLTTLLLVGRPDQASLAEAARASHELAELGLRNQRLLINGVFRAAFPGDPIAAALEARGQAALDAMPAALREIPRQEIPLVPQSLVGIDALRRMTQPHAAAARSQIATGPRAELPPALITLIDELAARGRGAIMTMGKGGVGKTTVAAAIAVELAHRGHPVYLTTTDPAAHVSAAVDGAVPNLRVGRIDPKAEVARYRDEVIATTGKGLGAAALALLEEDLRSPCTEEIAVFRAFAQAVDEARDGFVILDTAPTGHTILLLDAAEAYHREVLRTTTETPEAVRQLLPRLRDPGYTQILLVALPEATPVLEAQRLQNDLRRAGIEPYGWVVNQSLAGAGTADPLLQARAAAEREFIDRVMTQLSTRCALIPWVAAEPVGAAALRQLARS